MTSLPKTKKATYYAIKKSVFAKGVAEKGLYSIVGPRRVGKTILLKQLCEEFNGYYLSVEELKSSYNGSVEDSRRVLSVIVEAIQSDYKLVCIDEVTQMPDFGYGKLIHELKLAWNKAVFITGSIPQAVEDFGANASVEVVFRMSSLSYWEYCNWFECKVSSRSYENYLSFKQFTEIKDVSSYASSVLQGSMDSYRYNCVKVKEMEESVVKLFKEERFEDYLKLICLSGQFKLSPSGGFEDSPSLSQLDSEDTQELRRLKTIRIVKEERIRQLRLFLVYTGLGEYSNSYEYDESVKLSKFALEGAIVKDRFIRFEFPCFGGCVFNQLLTSDRLDLNHQCEIDIFNWASKLFCGTGKFRNNDDEEIDFVSRSLLIEIKNGSLKQIVSHMENYLSITKKLGVYDLLVTTSDKCLKFDDMGGVKVVRAYLPLLSYTLGEYLTFPKPKQTLEFNSAEKLYKSLKENVKFCEELVEV